MGQEWTLHFEVGDGVGHVVLDQPPANPVTSLPTARSSTNANPCEGSAPPIGGRVDVADTGH